MSYAGTYGSNFGFGNNWFEELKEWLKTLVIPLSTFLLGMILLFDFT